MAKYYVYCEAHGQLSPNYDTADQASLARSQHLTNVPGPHGIVHVIEEFTQNKYGRTVIALRQYKKRPS